MMNWNDAMLCTWLCKQLSKLDHKVADTAIKSKRTRTTAAPDYSYAV